jgi:SAM-dependent methyltransferase
MTRASGAGAAPSPESEAYLARRQAVPIAAMLSEAETYLHRIGRLRALSPGDRLLEIGVDTGWFLLAGAHRGLRCSGVEINPVFRDHALALARDHGVEVDIALGSIEDAKLPPDRYDAAVAMSVFEHVPDWESGLRNVRMALRPGGVLYLSSTNKFALRSGEYPRIPLYGWLPRAARRRLRVALQGEQVVASGRFDFNQFTYPGLRRALRRVGFSEIVDLFELLTVEDLVHSTLLKRAALGAMIRVPALKHAARTLYSGTHFFCVK